MSIAGNNAKRPLGAGRSVLNKVIRRSAITKDTPFVTEEVIPAGTYHTVVSAVMEAKTQKKKDAIDVVYTFSNDEGVAVIAKERFVLDGFRWEELVDHYFDCDLLTGDCVIADIKGIEEYVTVTYPRKGALGTLRNRQPCKNKSVSAPPAMAVIDDDSEFDDFLDVGDEED